MSNLHIEFFQTDLHKIVTSVFLVLPSRGLIFTSHQVEKFCRHEVSSLLRTRWKSSAVMRSHLYFAPGGKVLPS